MADLSGPDSGKPAAPRGTLSRAKPKRPGIRIDMTPMVDVAFLLLIFFMVTTVFRRPLAMEVNLPAADAKIEVPESNVLTVFVDQDEDLYVKIGRGGIEPITWADLTPTLLANAEANPHLIVLVKIHRGARYEPMVDMMDTLEDAKMERFSLIPMAEADIRNLEAAR
jgi:biopolymer transport protein ExbD